jgi:ParB family transcriptional regulator, chromosome partitioning protein
MARSIRRWYAYRLSGSPKAPTRTKLVRLPLDKLVALKRNPQYLTARQMDALKESIQRDGFLAPIVVRKKGARYEILSGNHRCMALRELQRSEVDCVEIIGCTDAQAARIAVNMNTVHGDPTPELIAPFLADLDEELLRTIHLDDGLLAGVMEFDATLAQRLKSLDLPDSLDHDSLRGTIPNCVCKCGHRHVSQKNAAAPKASKPSRRAKTNIAA